MAAKLWLFIPVFHDTTLANAEWHDQALSYIDGVGLYEDNASAILEELVPYLPKYPFRRIMPMFHAFERGHDIEPLGNISEAVRDDIPRQNTNAVLFVNNEHRVSYTMI